MVDVCVCVLVSLSTLRTIHLHFFLLLLFFKSEFHLVRFFLLIKLHIIMSVRALSPSNAIKEAILSLYIVLSQFKNYHPIYAKWNEWNKKKCKERKRKKMTNEIICCKLWREKPQWSFPWPFNTDLHIKWGKCKTALLFSRRCDVHVNCTTRIDDDENMKKKKMENHTAINYCVENH